jgi:hypothetical protein
VEELLLGDTEDKCFVEFSFELHIIIRFAFFRV